MADILASVSIALGMEISAFRANAAAVRRELRGMIQAGEALKDIGAPLSVLSAALGGLAGLAAKTAIDFESAFAGVKKTLDTSGLSAQQTQAEYERLSAGIRKMATEIPAAATEIAKVAEAAGQLGIKRENVLEFTKVMIDLGNSTNLSSDQAATSLARLANITQAPQTAFSNLGSAIVGLGNNFATTESEIVEMGLRIAAAGKQIGLADAQTLGFATALSSLGVPAEAGGTAISTVFKRIQVAVEQGGTDLAKFAKVSGVSAKEFAARFKTDAAGAVLSFTEGLGRIKDAGGSTIQTLQQLDLNDIRVSDSLLRLAGSGDLARRSVELGTKAFAENTALTKEAGQRYETTASQIQLAKNRVADLGITLGDRVKPLITAFAAAVGEVASQLKNMSPAAASATLTVVGIAAAIGPLALGIGTVITLLPTITAGFTALGTAVTFATGPIGIAVAAVAALAAGVYYLSQGNERALASFQEQRSATAELNSSIRPLLARYDELKAKTELSAAEQTELADIIKRVTAAVPGAQSAVDEYGNVTAIATEKTRDLIAAQQELEKTLAQKGIDGATQKLTKLGQELALLQRERDRYNKTGQVLTINSSSLKFSSNLDDVAKIQTRLRDVQKEYDETAQSVARMDASIRTSTDSTFSLSAAALTATENFRKFPGSFGSDVTRQLADMASQADAAAAKLNTLRAGHDAAGAAATAQGVTLGQLKQQLKDAQDLLDTQVGGTKDFLNTKANIARLEELIRKLTDTGKAARREASQIAEAFKFLRNNLRGIDTDVRIGVIPSGFDETTERVKALEEGLTKLARLGVTPANAAFAAFAAQLVTLRQSLNTATEPLEMRVVPEVQIDQTVGDRLKREIGEELTSYFSKEITSQPISVPFTLEPAKSASFRGSTEEVLAFTNANRELAASFSEINSQSLTVGKTLVGGFMFNEAAAQAAALENSINSLRNNGINALDPAIQSQIGRLNELQAAAFATQRQLDALNSAAYAIRDGISDAFAGFGDAIGQALAGTDTFANALFTNLLEAVGSMAIQLGQIAIGAGIAIESIKAALQSLQGVGAIVAGVALIALGSAVKGAVKGLAGGGGGTASFKPPAPSSYAPAASTRNTATTTAAVQQKDITIKLVMDSREIARSLTIQTDRMGRVVGVRQG